MHKYNVSVSNISREAKQPEPTTATLKNLLTRLKAEIKRFEDSLETLIREEFQKLLL